jgi:hypothetical protein
MIGLSPTQEIIFANLQVGEMRCVDLQYAIWRDRGPDKAAAALHSHVWELNVRLRPWAMQVRCRRCARNWMESVYYLQRLGPDATPPHKAFDRAGVFVG